METASKLINILLDLTAREDERHDAAIYLAKYPTNDAAQALASVASNVNEPDWLRDTCGESLALIWLQLDKVNLDIYNDLTPIAKKTAYNILCREKASLLDE